LKGIVRKRRRTGWRVLANASKPTPKNPPLKPRAQHPRQGIKSSSTAGRNVLIGFKDQLITEGKIDVTFEPANRFKSHSIHNAPGEIRTPDPLIRSQML
jgi:hypothetical protein